MKRYGIDGMQRYIAAAYSTPRLTPNEEGELSRRCLAGDMEARHELTRRNLRLVVAVVSKYQWKYLMGNMEDMVAEGNIGLFRATLDFDHSLGRFATHAAWWVRQAISRYISQKKDVIRIPENLYRIRGKVARGRELTPEESLYWSQSSRFCTFSEVSTSTLSPDDYDKMFAAEPVETFEAEHREMVSVHLAWLSPRDRQIVVERTHDGATLQVVADRHGVSKERVRQIVARFIAGVRKDADDLEKTGQLLRRIAS